MRTVTIDPDEPVVVRGYQFDYEAELARALLEANDVPCMLLHDTYLTLGLSAVRVAVRRGDVERALALLDAPPDDLAGDGAEEGMDGGADGEPDAASGAPDGA